MPQAAAIVKATDGAGNCRHRAAGDRRAGQRNATPAGGAERDNAANCRRPAR